MFVGSIPDKVRRYIACNSEIFNNKDVCVVASGNFSFEQIVSPVTNKLYSSDISLYSEILGEYFIDGDYKKKIIDPRFDYINNLNNEDYVSAVILLLEISKYIKQKNFYEKRMFNHYYSNFNSYTDKIKETLLKIKQKIKITKYFSVDAELMIESALKENMIIVSFLSTYAGGYEKIYISFQELFNYIPGEYNEIDENKYIELHEKIRQTDYFFYTDRPIYKDFIIKLKINNKRDIYLYSNLLNKKKYYDYTGLNEEVQNFKLLNNNDRITCESEISIVRTNNNVINHYRFLFLSKKVETISNGKYCYLVFIDNKLFGFLIYDNTRSAENTVNLWSDFIITSNHKRLSKLLICLARSREIITEIENITLNEYSKLRTSVFTDKPVSMKYRGEWELLKREPAKLIYETDVKAFSINEEYSNWYQKHYSK